MTNRRRFTLIEVLMVLVLIGVLMGVLLPTIGKAKERSKRLRARQEMDTLIQAIEQYQSTYAYLPVPQDTSGDTRLSDVEFGKLIGDLSCTTDSASTPNSRKNPRGIQMLKVLTDGGKYDDPWQKRYQIVIDTNYDDKISASNVYGLCQDVYASAVVWSYGPDEKQNTTDNKDKDNKDNVYSLETQWDPDNGHKPKK